MSADRKSSADVALFSWEFVFLKYLKYIDPQAAVLCVLFMWSNSHITLYINYQLDALIIIYS